MGSGTGYHESAGESESILFFIAWGAEGRYLFCVCGSSLSIFCFLVCIIIFLVIWFCMFVYNYGVRGGMHDTELFGEKRLFGAWSVQ